MAPQPWSRLLGELGHQRRVCTMASQAGPPWMGRLQVVPGEQLCPRRPRVLWGGGQGALLLRSCLGCLFLQHQFCSRA